MFKLIGVIFLLFNQVAIAENRLIIDKNDKLDFKCEAAINEDNVKFYFIDEAKRYKQGLIWNKETTSAIEYSWIVYMKKEFGINGSAYNGIDLSVRYFSRNDEEEVGDIAKLISISEVNSFGYSSDGFMPININRDSLNATIENDDLILTLDRNPNTSFIFDSYPSNAHFWVLADGENPRRCLARIKKK